MMNETVTTDGKIIDVEIEEPNMNQKDKWFEEFEEAIDKNRYSKYNKYRIKLLSELSKLTIEQIQKMKVLDFEKCMDNIEGRFNLVKIKDFLSKQSPDQKKSTESKVE